MIQLLMTIAIAAAALLFVVRWAGRTVRERRRPGRSVATAIPVEDYSDMDAAVRMEICPCRSRFILRGEGPLRHGARQLRVARLECRGCGRERALYFDLTNLGTGANV